MTIRNKTIRTALAYIAITDSKRCLHLDTRCAVNAYADLTTNWKLGDRHYAVSDEGMALARKSKLWQAHERITALGFELDRTRKTKPGFVSYRHPEQTDTMYGKRWRTAFTGKHGVAYVETVVDGRLKIEPLK